MHRVTQSIRFHLSLTYALAVFTVGSLLIGGLYVWQVRQPEQPNIMQSTFLISPETNQPIARFIVIEDFNRSLAELIQHNANLQALSSLRRASLAGLGVLFFISFGIGWLLAGNALRPVHRMAMVARDITATDLTRRISLPGPEDEMKGLADTFDAMLDRLQVAFEDQRRFVQDASHELRNPLAVARTNLELSLSDPQASTEDLRQSAGVAMRSTERMTVLVDDLLAQARSGVPEVSRSDVDLVATASDVVEEFSASAGQRNLQLRLVAPPAPMIIRGDGPALRRAISNLVSNAVKIAPNGTAITLSAALGDSCAMVSVADEGPGLTEAEQHKVFDRFWVGAHASAGTGLGLSIVRQIAERHNGTVAVAANDDSGSTFTIKVPIAGRRTAEKIKR